MKFSINDLMLLKAGLSALDGYDKIIKDGEKEKTAREFYKLGGGLRLVIAKNLNRIEPDLKAFEKARNDLVAQYSGGASMVPREKTHDFLKEERTLTEAETDVELIRIKSAELKLDENPIPASVLSLIVPILDE